MKKIYVPNTATEDDFEKSIFLAGPTPRSQDVKSWRPEFIKHLEDNDFDGTVLIPENEDGVFKQNYLDQVDWEFNHLEKATCIAFWVPRHLDKLPGFTTNVEFGYWIGSERIFYGRPPGAPKTRYLDWIYKKVEKQEPCDSMKALVYETLYWLGEVDEFNRNTRPYRIEE